MMLIKSANWEKTCGKRSAVDIAKEIFTVFEYVWTNPRCPEQSAQK